MAAIDMLEQAMKEVSSGKRIAYLGPEVSALSGGLIPKHCVFLADGTRILSGPQKFGHGSSAPVALAP